ncbi:MAG: hypothetical protein WD940_01940 [Patescibacteria group bacterium]
MSEFTTSEELMKAAKEFQAEKARREEAWAKRMSAEREPSIRIQQFGQEETPIFIDRQYSGVEKDVYLKFRKMPETGKMLRLELKDYKPTYLVEKTEEDEALLRIMTKDEIESKSGETPEDMREYLTDKTLEQLGVQREISQPEAQPEALPQAA